MTDPDRLPQAVLFDWDNTLVDNWGCIRAALNHALVAFGQEPWTEEETRARVRQSLRDSFPRMFGDDWMRARDLFYAHFEAHHLAWLRPLPGAEALLRALEERGVYQAIVSNKTGRFLRREVAHLGWERFFGQVVGAQDAAADKPAPDPVVMALAPAALAPVALGETVDVWFVGDADIDMECAHVTGCRPVLVGAGSDAGFGAFPPAHRYDDCGALGSLVCRIGDTISFPVPGDGG
jgi:phosphoglycolate phosphatase